MMRGLYAITPPAAGGIEPLVDLVRRALTGGAGAVQYRDKGTDTTRRRREVDALLVLCRSQSVPLIVNDDVALAAASGADGVHLGRDDGDLAAARRRLPAGTLIGISCYNELDRALAAQRAGADYVAFGSCFPSSTKPGAVHADLALLRRARAALRVPMVAIGGITSQNGRALIEVGVDMLAAIEGVFGQPDVEAAARAFNQLFIDAEDQPL